jgi:hypothetical protein
MYQRDWYRTSKGAISMIMMIMNIFRGRGRVKEENAGRM